MRRILAKPIPEGTLRRPTPARMTTLMAGLLARAFPPRAAFPTPASGLGRARLAAYTCVGSHGIEATPSPCSQLNPRRNHRGNATVTRI
jgi:hypothetical protein